MGCAKNRRCGYTEKFLSLKACNLKCLDVFLLNQEIPNFPPNTQWEGKIIVNEINALFTPLIIS